VGRLRFELDGREPDLLALWIGNTGLLEDLACHWARRLPLGLEFGFEGGGERRQRESCNRKSPACQRK
jgi:hypothetical protein